MKKRPIITLLCLALALATAACHRERKPEGLVPVDTLAAFLTEAHLAESYYAVATNHRLDSVYDKLYATYDTLFLKYGLTRERFDSSMVYYNDHQEELLDIFRQVEKNIECLREQYS